MKTRKLILILGVAAALIALTIYYAVRVGQAAKDFQNRIELPAFAFTQMNGKVFSRDSLLPDKPVVIMLFDPDCEHCQDEISLIQEVFSAFAGTQLLMTTPADRTRVIPFVKDKKLDELPGVQVVFTEPDAFLQAFGTLKMPSLYFYDSKWMRKKEMHGKVNHEKMLEALEMIRPG